MPKKEKIGFWKAVLLGFGIAIIFILITPRCLDVEEKSTSRKTHFSDNAEFRFVLDSLRSVGYAVENHYPIYIRVVKNRVPGDIVSHANAIAKSIKAHTGMPIKVQVDANGGTVIVDPDRGIIDPTKAIIR